MKSKPQSIAAIKRQRAKRIAAIGAKAYMLSKRGKEAEMYNLIFEEFVKLGGVYIKFLQGGLLHGRALAQWESPNRLNIYENLVSEPVDIVEFLRHELPPQYAQEIVAIQPEPFAAGSFGQVYYAQHVSGKPIVIKLLRPMIRELLLFDVKLLGAFFKKFMVKLYKNMNVQLDQAIKEFRDATVRETDYIHEATFAAELHEAYKAHPNILIPETFTHLCTKNIIVQEYISGISVAQLLKLKDQGVDPATYVRENLGSDLVTQLRAYGYQSIMDMFQLKRVQGDPHPGNIRLLPDNKVGVIDFGISARAPDEKAAFFGILESYDQIFKGSQSASDLFEHGLRFFVSDLYRSLVRLGNMMSGEQKSDFVKELSIIARDTFVQATGSDIVHTDLSQDQSIMVIINKIVNQGNRFGLVMKLESTEVLRAIQTYTSLVRKLDMYEPVVPAIMHQAVQDIKVQFPEVLSKVDAQMPIADALDTVTRWLERVATRDPALFQQLIKRIKITHARTLAGVQQPAGGEASA